MEKGRRRLGLTRLGFPFPPLFIKGLSGERGLPTSIWPLDVEERFYVFCIHALLVAAFRQVPHRYHVLSSRNSAWPQTLKSASEAMLYSAILGLYKDEMNRI